MKINPYYIKRLPKSHPKRLAYTLGARANEWQSRVFFDEYALPLLRIETLPPAPVASWTETQVSPEQASYLLWGLRAAEGIQGLVVEVGAWRGVTTAYLAMATAKEVLAIDPYIGDANEENYKCFCERTSMLTNVNCIREPFGQAIRNWRWGSVAFVFIDAAHDYVNVSHDLAATRSVLSNQGIVALHDTDNIAFSGCRRAVHEAIGDFRLLAHIDNLVLLRGP